MTVAMLLGLVHAATDLATVTAMVRATGLGADTAGAVFAWFLLYDVLAFAGQPFVGLVVDRLRAGPVVLAGLAVTGGAVALASGAGSSAVVGLAAVVVAALGNAVTHVGAGVVVLRGDLTRATPAGLLVAPGALGLGLGLWFGRNPAVGPTWWPAVPLAATAALALHLHRTGRLDPTVAAMPRGPGERLLPPPREILVTAAVGLLLLSVGIRALVAASAGRGYSPGAWLTAGIPLAAFAGKALGGVLADRLGWVAATVGALIVSLPFLAVQHAHPALLLVGLLVFQTTMPVTLVAVGRLLPLRPATAFGLPCAALLVGALPASFSWGAAVCARPALGAWIAVSVGAAWSGLHLAGLGRRRRAPAPGSAPAPAREPATEAFAP